MRVRVGSGYEDKDTDTPEGMELQGQLATDLGIEGLECLLPQAVVRRDVAEQGGTDSQLRGRTQTLLTPTEKVRESACAHLSGHVAVATSTASA